MGEMSDFNVASWFLWRTRLHVPIPPLLLARAAGYALERVPGVRAQAKGCVLCFDDALPDWRTAVAYVACGRILRLAHVRDTVMARVTLSRLLAELPSAMGTHC